MSVSVVVDDREPASVSAALRAHAGVNSVAVRRLDAGDLIIRDVAFEGKTSDDYLRSVLDRGGSDLEEQVARMTAAHDHAYVFVEDHLDEIEERRPGVAGASVRGSMASVTARYDAPVISCGDGERFVDVAVRLARKHTEESSARSLSPGAVPSWSEPVAKRMYDRIEGVGPGAAAIYEAFRRQD